MTVPGRKINAEGQAKFSRSFGDAPHHIAAPILPGAAFHAVTGLGGGPQTETVMVLGHENHIGCASRFDRAHPLFRIKIRGSKYVGAGRAVTPLAIQERVGAEMDDDSEFEILPRGLLWRGLDVGEVLGATG